MLYQWFPLCPLLAMDLVKLLVPELNWELFFLAYFCFVGFFSFFVFLNGTI